MTMTGVVLSVDVKSAGIDVRADAAIGDVAVLGVDSINLPRGGGALQLPSGAVVAYVAADHDEDAVTLADPLTEALLEGDRLLLLPVRSFTQATVQTDGDGSGFPVRVSHAMQAMIGLGVREPGEGEIVDVEMVDGDLTIVDMRDRPPAIDAHHISNAEELVLENERMLGEVLAENAQAMTTAQGRLTAAEGQISDAFSEIDIKPDNDYVDAAKQQAIDAAAIDAQAKADAAEAAAAQTAAADATAKADAALDAAKDDATTRTDGLAKTISSTSLPGATQAPKDSTWYKLQVGTGKIESVFMQTADPKGATWVARPIRSEAIDNLDAGKITASGATLQTAVVQQFAAQLANIIEANIGNLTVTGGASLNSVVAQQIAADTASFLSITANQILGGDIQAAWSLGTDGVIYAGDPTGARVEITDEGIRVFVLGFNGQPYEVVSMVNGELSFGVMGQDGTRIAGISASGHVTGKRGAFSQDATIMGIPIVGQEGGGAQQGWIDRKTSGLVKSNSSNQQTLYYTAEKAYVRLAVWLKPGRTYRVVGTLNGTVDIANGVLRANLRYVFGSGSATVSSTEVFAPTTSGQFYSPTLSSTLQVEGLLSVTTVTRANIILTRVGLNGAKAAARRGMLYVEDMGPLTLEEGGEDSEPKTEYTTVWQATASRGYDKTGARLPAKDDIIDLWYFGIPPTHTAENAAVLFDGPSVSSTDPIDFGVTLNEALTGATLYKMELYLRNASFSGAPEGVTTVNTLGSGALPTTKTIDGSVLVDGIPEGAGVWVTLPPSWFTNGTNKGITLGDKDRVTLDPDGNTVGLVAAIFHGPSDPEPPLLRATYYR